MIEQYKKAYSLAAAGMTDEALKFADIDRGYFSHLSDIEMDYELNNEIMNYCEQCIIDIEKEITK